MKMYSVIIPVYNEEEIILESYDRLKVVMDALNNPYELVFVDDGSKDKTVELLKEIADYDTNVKVLILSRNFGHQLAVTAGLNSCNGDAVIIIDADMQDPPELIPQMIDLWKQGNQIVYGKRMKRKGESVFKLVTAKVYYRLLKRLSDESVPPDVGDFRLLDRKVVNIMNEMGEHNRYLRGMSAWTGFKQIELPYIREERVKGASKYTLKKMTKLAVDGAISMSNKPIKMLTSLGLLLLLLGGIGLLISIIIWIMNGINPVMLIMSFSALMTGLIITSMGILGAYVGRVYDEVKSRPLYIISEMLNFKE